MLTCKEVSHDLAADVLRSGGFSRRFAIRLHLLMCGKCRSFARQLKQIGAAMRDLSGIGETRGTDDGAEARVLARIQRSRSATDGEGGAE
jgi:hypothetical protein